MNDNNPIFYKLDYSHEELEALLDKLNFGYVLSEDQFNRLKEILQMNISEFDGNYEKLTNKPKIPSSMSELNNDMNFQTADNVNQKLVILNDNIMKEIDKIEGPQGAQGVSIVSIEIIDDHLIVTLSNGDLIDAGKIPVPETVKQELIETKQELVETKQELLDLTYGVEYEWIYFDVQAGSGHDVLNFNKRTAPGFYEDWLPIEDSGDDELIEEFILRMYEEDIYRIYCLRLTEEAKFCNRYELVPMESHQVQKPNPNLAKWKPVRSLKSWNWSGDSEDGGFVLDAKPTSAMIFAFLKVKK